MRLTSETYMLYGVIFVLILLGLLLTLVKRLGSSKSFPTPNESREKEKKWILGSYKINLSGYKYKVSVGMGYMKRREI